MFVYRSQGPDRDLRSIWKHLSNSEVFQKAIVSASPSQKYMEGCGYFIVDSFVHIWTVSGKQEDWMEASSVDRRVWKLQWNEWKNFQINKPCRRGLLVCCDDEDELCCMLNMNIQWLNSSSVDHLVHESCFKVIFFFFSFVHYNACIVDSSVLLNECVMFISVRYVTSRTRKM